MRRFVILLLTAWLAAPAAARPPTYADGWADIGRALWARIVDQVPAQWLAEHHPPTAVGRLDGRLLFGRAMVDTPEVWTRHAHSSWAVPELVHALQDAHAAVQKRFPGGMDLSVGDISLRRGGRYPPHRTHQSGRDADMRYYIKGVQPGDRERYPVGPDNMDVERQWAFVQHLYDTQQASLIYMDVRHQKTLHTYATKVLGMTEEQLKPILSYPFGQRRESALVQHVRGHYNHLHVRAAAPIACFFGALYTLETAAALQQRVDLVITGHFEHVIKSGETLGHIARQHNVRLEDLMAWNGLSKRSKLRPGQVLKVQVELGQQ